MSSDIILPAFSVQNAEVSIGNSSSIFFNFLMGASFSQVVFFFAMLILSLPGNYTTVYLGTFYLYRRFHSTPPSPVSEAILTLYLPTKFSDQKGTPTHHSHHRYHTPLHNRDGPICRQLVPCSVYPQAELVKRRHGDCVSPVVCLPSMVPYSD